MKNAPSTFRKRSPPILLNIGPVGDLPGGMAQMARVLSDGMPPGVEVIDVRTLRRKRDPISTFLYLQAIGVIVKGVRTRRSATICVHLSEGGSFLREGSLLAIGRKLGYRVVAYLHGAHFDEFALAHPGIVRGVLRRANGIIALTAAASLTAKRLATHVPVLLANNPVVVPQQVSLKSRTVVFAGEVSRRKGADVLLEAWAESNLHERGWTLDVIGPATRDVPQRPIPGVRFLGPLPNAQVRASLATAHVAVLPSRAEAMPMFLLEAAAHGCALIATDVGNIRDLVDLSTGRLVPECDPELVRAAIEEVAAAIDQGNEEAGQSARRRVVGRFDVESVMRQILPVLFPIMAPD